MGFRNKIAMMIGGKGFADQIAQAFSVYGSGAPRMGSAELMQAFSTSPWLRSVCAKIADHIASIPFTLHAKTDRKTRKTTKAIALQNAGFTARRKLFKQYTKQNTLIQIENHPLLDLLANANPDMSGIAARKMSSIHLNLKGEYFWILENNAFNRPVEYWPVPPDWVTGIPVGVKSYFEVTMKGRRVEVPKDSMIWVRDLNPADPFSRGSGFGEALMDEIDTDEYAAKVAKNVFFNKGKIDMVAIVQGARKEELETAEATFNQKFRGYNNANRVMWTSGNVEFKELQQKFADLQLMELRSWEREAFITVFGVPPEILGLLKNSNRATVTEAQKIFAGEVLIPRLELERAELQRQLVPLFDDRLILDYVSPMPDDEDFTLEAMKAAPHTVTQGEWRRLQGLDDRGEEDNVQWVPLNLLKTRAGTVEDETIEEVEEETEDLKTDLLEEEKGFSINKASLPEVIAEGLDPIHFKTEWDPVMNSNIEQWGNETLEELGVQPSFNMVNPLVVAHLAEQGVKITGINETTRVLIVDQLAEGVALGEDARRLAKRVETVFEDSKGYRSLLIARTEVVGTANMSTFAGYKQSGLIKFKEWVATPDTRTRHSHWVLGTQKPIPIDQPFVYGDHESLYPGNFGVGSLDCQCRCTIVAAKDPNAPRSVEEHNLLWKAYDAKLIPWEKQIEEATKRAFDKQKADILRRLNHVLGNA